MSVEIYDKAIVAKLKYWTENTTIQVYGPNETSRLFEVIADQTNDKPIQLPLLCLSRRGGYSIKNVNKQPMTYGGLVKAANEESALQINSIPVNLPYQIDIYTRYRAEADAYCRDLVFNIINYPTFEITIPYEGQNLVHNGTMYIESNVQDNSDIPERLIKGQFSRMSILFTVDDARLWDIRKRSNVSIGQDIKIDIHDNELDYVTEIVKL